MSRVTTRFDDELGAEIEAAADELGSKSDVVRVAVRQFLDDGDDERRTDGGLPDHAELTPVARQAYRALVESFGTGRIVQLEAFESTTAAQTNCPKEAIRGQVLKPLKRAGLVSIHQRVSVVGVEIHGVDT